MHWIFAALLSALNVTVLGLVLFGARRLRKAGGSARVGDQFTGKATETLSLAETAPVVELPIERADEAKLISDAGTPQSPAFDLAARNAAILQSSMDGFFILGGDYRFIEANAAYCRMVGYSSAELLAMKISDIEVPQAFAGRNGNSTDIARTGHHLFSTQHRHKDGHEVELEVSVIAMPGQGCKTLVGFARDVTERVRASQRLLQTTERFESVVSRMPLGRVVWSRDFVVQEWNPAAAAIFGYTAQDALGRSGLELIAPGAERAEIESMWNSIVSGQPNVNGVHTARRSDGETIRCEWSNVLLQDDDGTVTGVFSFIRDVTQRERLEQRLRESQKLESLGVLAGGVAHDFNNFLVGVLCNSRLVLDRMPDDSDARPYLNRIINAGRRASELTRQMLAYSGRGAFDVRPMALNDLISEMADLLHATMPKTIALNINLQKDLPAVEADSGQMQQVIMNLLMNAAEAIGERPGVVSVSSYIQRLDARQISAFRSENDLVPGSYVCLEVGDNGCGMTAETQARIFDPFFTTKFTGRGLGLAAILGIIRSHHGALRVVSEENVGTVFTVLLPGSEVSVPRPRITSAPAALRPGQTVLVVDDEEEIRDVVEAVLVGRGLRVLTAENGLRGIELFKQHGPHIDLVLLDMTMPGLGGEAVMQEMISLRPDAKIILSSGYAEEQAIGRLTDTRPAGFVQKPYTIDVLLEKVGGALA